jgi:hypothetical protein
MDMTSYISAVPSILDELRLILKGKTIVACLEHMKWLGAFICIEPIHASLVGAATTEDEGFFLVEKELPDYLVVSQKLEDGSGLSLIRRAEQLRPSIKTLLVIDGFDQSVVEAALGHGCDGICTKSESFMQALRAVAGGGVFYPQAVAEVLQQKHKNDAVDPLTKREVEVVQALALGLTDQEIAKALVISPETARTHVKHIYQKLQVSNRTKAAVKAIALGLISVE